MDSNQRKNNKYNDLWKYAGLGAQLFTALGLSVFAGIKADNWLNFSTPLLVWVLPLLLIAVMMIKIIKDTAKPK